MKSLSTGKIWLFAAGQFGWSLLSGLISNWLVYFYQPDEASIAQGQTLFIPQGLVVLGIFRICRKITDADCAGYFFECAGQKTQA